MLDKIYSSTLFKASINKAAIRSALQNPVNLELAQQLREYLDDDVVDQLEAEPVEEPAEDIDRDTDNTEVENTQNEDKPSETKDTKSSLKPASFTSKSDHMEDLKEFEKDMDAVEPPVQSESNEEESKSDVESSVCITDKLDLEALQGTINSREDTAGVSYILQKDNELWIHYNDSTNLNNVMENLIMLIRDLNYDNLTFNRLARSANAVVFEIVTSNINNYTMTGDNA